MGPLLNQSASLRFLLDSLAMDPELQINPSDSDEDKPLWTPSPQKTSQQSSCSQTSCRLRSAIHIHQLRKLPWSSSVSEIFLTPTRSQVGTLAHRTSSIFTLLPTDLVNTTKAGHPSLHPIIHSSTLLSAINSNIAPAITNSPILIHYSQVTHAASASITPSFGSFQPPRHLSFFSQPIKLQPREPI